MPSEVRYLPVVGFPDYRVGDDGSVWSRKVAGSRYGRIGDWKRLRTYPTGPSGHQCVCLRRGNESHQKLVHRLVLEAFVGPCPAGMECCHFPDRNPRNNAVTNLRWDTSKANSDDRIIHGTANRGSRHGHAKATEEIVVSLRADHAAGVPQVKLAKKHGLSRAAVCLIINRKTWSHV